MKKTTSKKKAPSAKGVRIPKTAPTGIFTSDEETEHIPDAPVPRSAAVTVSKTRISSKKKAPPPPPPVSYINEEDDYDDDESPREKYMSLGDHLEELRTRILWIVGVLTAATIGAAFWSADLHSLLIQPYREVTDNRDLYLMNVYGPMEFLVKLSLLTGITVSFPVILSILWGFATPAVSRLTAFLGHLAVASSALLFWFGIFFAWEFILPISLDFLFHGIELPGITPQITLEKYYSFLFMLVFASGIIFQLPLLLVILGGLGLITTEFHKRTWKYSIVGIFIFAAVITPPDPVSQLLFAAPVTVLYFIAVGIVWIIEKIQDKKYAESA